MNFKVSKTGNPIVDYLTVMPEALAQIKKLLSKRTEPCEGIRVSVRTRGWSGLSYTIEFAIPEKNISKYDDVILCEDNNQEIQIFIDPKVSMFLIGSEMVFKEDELSSGFDFVNPNEKGRCGCGESFNV